MALLNILRFPDARLRSQAKLVENFDSDLKQLVDDMLQTMYEGRGIGLAATQVNIAKKIITIDISDDQNEPLVLINPEVLHKEGKVKSTEGCLSVPGIYENVNRAALVKVKAYNKDGQTFEIETGGLLGRCIQHEFDHLNGKLFIDHLSRLKRERVLKKLKKFERQTL